MDNQVTNWLTADGEHDNEVVVAMFRAFDNEELLEKMQQDAWLTDPFDRNLWLAAIERLRVMTLNKEQPQ